MWLLLIQMSCYLFVRLLDDVSACHIVISISRFSNILHSPLPHRKTKKINRSKTKSKKSSSPNKNSNVSSSPKKKPSKCSRAIPSKNKSSPRKYPITPAPPSIDAATWWIYAAVRTYPTPGGLKPLRPRDIRPPIGWAIRITICCRECTGSVFRIKRCSRFGRRIRRR